MGGFLLRQIGEWTSYHETVMIGAFIPEFSMPSTLAPSLTPETLDDRIVIHEGAMVAELSYRDLYFHTSADVNAFFDRVEDRLAETGEPLWFLLSDVTGYRLDDRAWLAFSRRNSALREGHSMGHVRYDTSPGTAEQIARTVGTDNFDPTLFADRDSAFSALRNLPSKRRHRVEHKPNFEKSAFVPRIVFNHDAQIMNVDFSGVSFEHSRDVNDIYNWIEELIRPTGRKWYFLINYEGTRIQDPAWVQFAARGKALNESFSLGSVRYAPGSETEADIRLRAETQGFRPNIRNTRAEAIARINEMKSEAGS